MFCCCLAIQHQLLTISQPALGKVKLEEQPQLAPSDCLMSSHTLYPTATTKTIPNHTNFPYYQLIPLRTTALGANNFTYSMLIQVLQKATLAWVSCLLG